MNHTTTRRNCLKAVAAAPLALASQVLPLAAQVSSKAERSKLAMPGLYRGRVIAVRSEASIVTGKYQAEPVRAMLHKGMQELTGAGNWAEAWRAFVSPGERVGIKVNPVGAPHVISAAEVVRELIDGLQAAGIKRNDIVVYDRYRAQFFKAGFDKWLPEGV
ncbi:MAG: DUF362 domain-containing protein, partial [Bryobacteraceae bacterium]